MIPEIACPPLRVAIVVADFVFDMRAKEGKEEPRRASRRKAQ